MLIDVTSEPPSSGTSLRATVCIIGAGAAGLTATRELARLGIDVITLEAGGLKESKRSQDIYRGKNTGRRYFKLHRARRRFLGGSTNCWAGLCTKLRPTDFAKRAWIPHSGWPITRSDLDPYYDRAGEFLKIGSFHPQLDKPLSKGQYLRGPGLKINRFESVYFQMSPPARLGELWREELTQEERVKLLLNANVVHLQLTTDGQQLDHVVCQAFDGVRFTVKAQYFILACGGIENPRMLLNARDVATTGIGNQRDLVGRFFMEHPHIDRESLWFPAGAVPSLRHYHRRNRKAKGDRIWPYLRLRADELEREELLDFSLVLFRRRKIAKEARRHPLLKEMFHSTQHLHHAESTSTKRKPSTLKKAYTFGNPMEQAPNPESRILLAPDGDQDELGLIRTQANWQLTELEKRTLRRGHELVAEAICQADYGRVRVTPTLNLETFPRQLKGGYHHMGTTRMSDQEATGVVDQNGKVFGVANLFVAGSSVFTTSGAANPTLSIVALALRLADHLKGKLSDQPTELKQTREGK